MPTYDVIVVGLGAMGSAAAYQLSARGLRVLGIDAYHPPHAMGSSHGESRVTRQACHEGPAYSPLAIRSNEIWTELEARSGIKVFDRCGFLQLVNPERQTPHHGTTSAWERITRSADTFGIRHEVLSSKDVRRRFPMFEGLADEEGYYEPDSGALSPERAVDVQLQQAKALGAEFFFDSPVLEWSENNGGVDVHTASGRHQAEQLVLSVGSWVAKSLEWPNAPFNVRRQILHWFAFADGQAPRYDPSVMPVYIWDALPESFYGFPALAGPAGGLKIAIEQNDVDSDPDDVDRSVHPEDIERAYTEAIAPHFSGVTSQSVRTAMCLYTNTPDFDFVIDRHPDHEQVLVASPCSGHGFKHSAAVGEVIAELVAHGSSSRWDPIFALSRLGSPNGSKAR